MDDETPATPTTGKRRLAYRLAALPYQVRLDIGRRLGLLADDFVPESDQQVIVTICDAARVAGIVDDLAENVDRYYEGNFGEGNSNDK